VGRGAPDEIDTQIASGLEAICGAVQRQTGRDFSQYKAATLRRRIRRRMEVSGCGSVPELLERLERSPEQAEQLVDELLIGVSSFFRDPESFQALGARVLPLLAAKRSAHRPLRVWVPGCSTGEEAYSLAILFDEFRQQHCPELSVQLFATDLDRDALLRARAGRFGAAALANVSPERLQRYFGRDGEGYRVVDSLRDTCIFSLHDVAQDPPFSALSLISCRNVLIYMRPELQDRVFALFHYALERDGVLFVGPSEGLSGAAELFELVDEQQRFFRRRDTAPRPAVEFPRVPRRSLPVRALSAARNPAAPLELASEVFERMLLEEYVPASAILSEDGAVLYLAGGFGRYVQPARGVPLQNVLDQTRGPFRHELRSALNELTETRRSATRRRVTLGEGASLREFWLTLRLLPVSTSSARLFATVLEPLTTGVEPAAEEWLAASGTEGGPIIDQLEGELRATRAELRTTVEDLEAANEELKSSNEELVSTNEELHAANEELQASQEEVQASNEELSTVNAELVKRVRELKATNLDLQNLLASTQVATIFLNLELAVTRFTPEATALYALFPGDTGRSLADFAPQFVGPDVVRDARTVLRTGLTLESEAVSRDGSRTYAVRCFPYRTLEDEVGGVVVTFHDVTARKRAEEALRRERDRVESVMETSPVAIVSLNREGQLTYANSRAEELLMLVPQDERKRFDAPAWHITDFDGNPFPTEELPFARVARTMGPAYGVRHAIERPDGERVLLAVNAAPLRSTSGEFDGAVATLEDVTEKIRAERALIASEQRYRLLFENLTAGFALHELIYDDAGRAVDYRFLEINPAFEKMTGIAVASATGKTVREVIPNIEQHWIDTYARVAETGEPLAYENFAEGLGRHFAAWAFCPQPRQFAVLFTDVTELKQAEAERRRLEKQLLEAQKMESLGVMAGGIGHDFNNLLMGVLGNVALGAGELAADSPALPYMQAIRETAVRLSDLTRQMLAYAGKGSFMLAPVSLTRVVESIASLLHVSLPKTARVNYALAEDLPCVEGDEAQFGQVVMNLITNAAEALGGQDGDIVVRTSAVSRTSEELAGFLLGENLPPGEYVYLEVADTGAGMDSATRARIFEPFYSTKFTGRGLGLAAVIGIVRGHRGAIELESEVGRGTRFRVYFPKSDAMLTAPKVQAASAAWRSTGLALVVDDEPVVRRTTGAMLRRIGFEVLTAPDGQEAVTLVRERGRELRLVVLDLTMPRMDGLRAAEELETACPSAKILVSSGYDEAECLKRFAGRKIAGFLHKPYDLDSLAAACRAALEAP
jgi:two-component system CheB/CheR fusion protein